MSGRVHKMIYSQYKGEPRVGSWPERSGASEIGVQLDVDPLLLSTRLGCTVVSDVRDFALRCPRLKQTRQGQKTHGME